MIRKNNSFKPSINSIVIPLIIFSVILSITINIFISYFNIKDKYLDDVKNNLDKKAIILSKSISGFIESYNINEYAKLIKNELKNDDIIAIIVNDFKTAAILNENSFITGNIHIDNKIASYNIDNPKHVRIIEKSFYQKKIDITDEENNNIGELYLYESDEKLSKKIQTIISDNIIYGFFSAILIIISILVVLRIYLSNPIELIIKNLRSKEIEDKDFDKISKEIYLKEIDILFDAIENMYKNVKSSNEKLSHTKSELIKAQKVAKTGHFVFDLKTDDFESSEVLNEIFELESEDKKSFNTWINLIDPKDKESMMEYYNFISGNNLNFDKKYKIITPSGKEKWVHGIAIFERDENNKPTKLFGTIRDITKNMEYETKLHQALTVFNNTHDGIMITDSDANIINVNRSFEKITGYKLQEVIGKNPRILKSEVHDKDFYKQMWDDILEKGSWTGEVTNKNKEGDYFQELLTINKIEDNNGNIINHIGVFNDITIQKEQEKILLQQSRTSAVGEMIGNIAHQWRQPLSVISTVSSGIRLHMQLDGKVENELLDEKLTMIVNQTKYLSKTIDDFRNFFRGDQKEIEEVLLIDTINKAATLTKDSFTNNFIEFKLNIDESIILKINENLFIQGIINLFNNAKDALIENLKDHRYFYVQAYKEENNIIIKLLDNAGGIKKENIAKIFDPYFTTKHKSIGTGLGLHMTHQIIDKHLNGHIHFSNQIVNYKDKTYTGAEFTIVLPLEPEI